MFAARFSFVSGIAGALAAVVLIAATAAPAEAQSRRYANMSCNQLWYERNLIYANRGYCFRTQRAIRTFGPRCYPPYGRLSQAEHRAVADIQWWERRRGCR